jgi:hypothetical protein
MAKPTFQLKPPRFRGHLSADMNTMFADIENDLHSGYLDQTILKQKINELRTAITREQVVLSTRISSLEDRINALYEASAGQNIIQRSFDNLTDIIYHPTTVVATTERCTVNTEYRNCHLPINSDFSQLRFQDIASGDTIINADVEATVSAYAEGTYGEGDGEVEETDVDNMLDGSPTTFYQRKVKFPIYSGQPAVECEMLITLPQTFDSYSNTFTIAPFPEMGVHILSIEFATADNPTSFITLAEEDFIEDGMIEDSTRMQFKIREVEAAALRIRLRQDRWLIENGEKVFTYGIRDIDIRRTLYNNTGDIGVKFSMPSSVAGYFNQITGFTTYPSANYGTISYVVYPNLASFNVKANGYNLAASFPMDIRSFLTRDVYVGISMQSSEIGRVTPSLERMFMTYTTFQEA